MNAISKVTWRAILLYLTPRDLCCISVTCTDFYTFTKDNDDLIAKQFHSLLVSSQDVFISSIHESPVYVARLKTIITQRMTGSESASVKSFSTAKLSLKELLNDQFGREKSTRFVQTVSNALMRPDMPSPKLLRENDTCETYSSFQNFLSSVYHGTDDESQGVLSGIATESDTFEFTKDQIRHFSAVNMSNKDSIMYTRWYLQEQCKENYQFRDEQGKSPEPNIAAISAISKRIQKMHSQREQKKVGLFKKNHKSKLQQKAVLYNISKKRKGTEERLRDRSPLIELYKNLHQVFSTFCETIHDCLQKLDSPLIFMIEYSTRWKNYVSSMQKIGNYLRHYSELVNTVYEREFEDYPNYPNFRVWRMMTKIWYNKVFCRLQEKMLCSLSTVVDSCLESFSSRADTMHIEEEFMENNAATGGLGVSSADAPRAIGEFWNSVLDMALNERTLFNLSCTDFRNSRITARFCETLYQLVSKRCETLLTSSELKPVHKFEKINADSELLEGIILRHLFPELFEVLTNALQSILVQYLSALSNMSVNEVTHRLCSQPSGSTICSWLSLQSLERIRFAYPSFEQHLTLCRTKASLIADVHCRRQELITESVTRGFNPLGCEIEKTFMDFDRTVSINVLREVRATQCH